MMFRYDDDLKRGGIYFFYDQDGIVDDYISYLLDDLIENIDELVVVCNGKLNEDGYSIFGRYADKIIVRPNEGLDVWAYKTGLSYYGWDKIEQFDELVMLNHTIMGPVYPFHETFDKMKGRDVDFWGITKHNRVEEDIFGINPYGYMPEHIQSHFMVFRKKLLCSKEFQDYWDNFRQIKNYRESVGYHESYFTKYFSDLGYKWEVSVDVSDLQNMSDNPGFYCIRELIEQRQCPIFKRRAFFHDYGQFLETTAGQVVYELYRYLEASELYDTEMIWQNILRTMDHTEIAKNLHLDYTLPSKIVINSKAQQVDNKVAILIHIYYLDEFDKMIKYVRNMPSNADIYITTQNDNKKRVLEEKCKGLPNKVEVSLVKNRGRDVASLLIKGRELVGRYKYICFIHDKKVTQDKPGTIGEGFAYNCYENTLGTKEYVENVINLFEENNRLGVLCPPKPNHGPYILSLVGTWEKNYYNTVELLKKLGIDVPIDKCKVPIAPHGSCFWFRTEAVRKLFEYNWNYEDFPEEPLSIDGTISHAIERCYAYVAQDAGFYTAVAMIDEYSRIEYTTLMHYSVNHADYAANLMNIGRRVNFHGWDYRIKYFLRRILPKKIFVSVINAKRRVMGPYKIYKYEDN